MARSRERMNETTILTVYLADISRMKVKKSEAKVARVGARGI